MDKQMKGSSLKKIGALLPWLWLAAGYVLDMWFQLVPGKWIVDSDLASEMMLTKILNQEGSILSHSWYYSTELRVVNMQWFYRLGLLLKRKDLTVPELPFSKIDELGAGMYKGEKVSRAERHSKLTPEE